MTVLYISDDKGIMFLGVSLTSLYVNNAEIDNLDVIVVDDNISTANKQMLKKCALKYGREIKFVKIPQMNKLLEIDPPEGRWPSNVFCRLFVPTLLKDYSLNRILYLDTDIIVNGNLLELWNTDLNGFPCGAVLECMGDAHKRIIGLNADTAYLNSGMLLIDVDKWIQDDMEAACRNFIRNNYGQLEYPDESTLNGVLKGQFKILPPEYNLTSLKCVFSFLELKRYRKSNVMYKESEYIKAKEKPLIVHYTNSFIADRPWISNSKYPHTLQPLWESYKEISLWKDAPMLLKPRTTRSIIENKIRKLPRNMTIFIMGFIFCYVKPLQYIRVRKHEL